MNAHDPAMIGTPRPLRHYTVEKLDFSTGEQIEIASFRPASREEELDCLRRAREYVYALQRRKRGAWTGRSSFATDLFGYHIALVIPSRIHLMDEEDARPQSFSTLTPSVP